MRGKSSLKLFQVGCEICFSCLAAFLSILEGPGLFTRSLLSLPASRIRKLIVLEEDEMFHESLTVWNSSFLRKTTGVDFPLSDSRKIWFANKGRPSFRSQLVDLRPFRVGWSIRWCQNVGLERSKCVHKIYIYCAPLTKITLDPSNLHFIAHIPHTVAGDQLVAQLFRCIPDRSWLFKYGRVPMSFLMDQNLWQVIIVCGRFQYAYPIKIAFREYALVQVNGNGVNSQ